MYLEEQPKLTTTIIDKQYIRTYFEDNGYGIYVISKKEIANIYCTCTVHVYVNVNVAKYVDRQ